MEINLPESSILKEPHKIEGSMAEARELFYELAKSRIKYLSSQEIIEWHRKMSGLENRITSASYVVSCAFSREQNNDLKKMGRGSKDCSQ